MKSFIPLFCFSLLLAASLFSEEEPVRYTSEVRARSTWEIKGKPIVLSLVEKQESLLTVKKSKGWKFPLTLELNLQNASLEVQAEEKKLFHTVKDPGPFLSLAELARFVNKPFHVILLDGEPPFRFEEPFAAKFSELSGFDQPLFEGVFVLILRDLMQILQQNLKAGEGFAIEREKSKELHFASKSTYSVSENSAKEMIVHSTFAIDRQKTTLPGQKESAIPAVVFGELKGKWTIQKQNPLIFQFQDSGTISYAIGFEDTQASIVHAIERKAETEPLSK